MRNNLTRIPVVLVLIVSSAGFVEEAHAGGLTLGEPLYWQAAYWDQPQTYAAAVEITISFPQTNYRNIPCPDWLLGGMAVQGTDSQHAGVDYVYEFYLKVRCTSTELAIRLRQVCDSSACGSPPFFWQRNLLFQDFIVSEKAFFGPVNLRMQWQGDYVEWWSDVGASTAPSPLVREAQFKG